MISKFSVVVSAIIIAIVCLCKNASAQTNRFPNTPCPEVFQYMRRGNKNIGVITINSVGFGKTTVAVELSQQGYMELNNPGQLSLNFNKDKIYEYLEAGRPFTYKLDFPIQNVVPRVTSISVNGYQICSGPGYDSPRTNMKLEHTLNAYSSGSGISPQNSVENYNARQPSRQDLGQGYNIGQSSRPSNLHQGSTFGENIPGFLKFSPSYAQQMANNPSSSLFNQQSYTQPSFTPSYTQPAFAPPSQHSYPINSNLPEFLKFSPSFVKKMSTHQPSPSYTEPSYTQAPYTPGPFYPPQTTNYQQDSIFSPNPQNSFLNISPPPPSAKPTESPTSRVPEFMKPIFRPPTTTQAPSFDINIRNPDSSAPTAEWPPKEIASTDRSTIEYINSVCGQENSQHNSQFRSTKLNFKGDVISKARFPWIVAIFKKAKDDPDFQCGGSLISTRTVVSAAHCFYIGLVEIKPEEIILSMGLHNLTDWSDANNIDAKSVILHPDYKPLQTNFDADLAIIRLQASVTFTAVIRPICIWKGNIDPREIVGINGIIVGWGSDGRHRTTVVPTLVNATIAAPITCIRSNVKFLSLKTNRTICAGNTDGSGPCMGDSGNGLMIRNRNKWMLRGTVSAALGDSVRQCVLDDYAIYSDIAMFIEWIQSNMLL